MLMCSLLAHLALRWGWSDEKAPVNVSLAQRRREWILAVVWALHIAMSNIGLKSVSVHLFVVVKCAGPVASALLSWLILRRPASANSLVSLFLLVAGPALAVHSELDVTWFGVVSTVSVVLLTSLKVVLSTLLFTGKQQWDSLPLLAEMAPKACILLLPWSCYEIWSNDAAYQMGHLSLTMMGLLGLSGVAAFGLNYNNFLIFKYLDSPVAVAVFTNLRKVLMILVSIWLFDKSLGTDNLFGIAITFLGVFLFTRRELQEQRLKNLRKNRSKLDVVV